MTYTCFELSVDAGVAHLRLNHPERFNSMVREFWAEIPRAMHELEERGGVRVALISSTGKHFTAGMDLALFGSGDALGTTDVNGRERFRRQLMLLQASFSAIAAARFPVIAAIQGGCVGGGVDLVTACCLRYCTREAYFMIHEINIAMMADVGTMNRMPKQLPEAVMRELAYTGDRLGAERAERLGFVNGVFEDHDALVAGTLEVARRIASKAPMAVAATKEMIAYTRDHSVAESFEYLNALQPGIFNLEDLGRAVAAQKSKSVATYEDLPPLKPAIG